MSVENSDGLQGKPLLPLEAKESQNIQHQHLEDTHPDLSVKRLQASGNAPSRVRIDSAEVNSGVELNVDNVLNVAYQIGDSIQIVEAVIQGPPPSLASVMDKWGNNKISLLYHEFLVAKSITGSIWGVTQVADVAGKLENKGIGTGLMIAEGVAPEFAATAFRIEQTLAEIALAYKIPSTLGKSAVLLYKKMLLVEIGNALKKNPEGMTKEQKAEFKEWLDAEKREISKAAKGMAVAFGVQLPGNLLTAIRLCQFNIPLLRLGLIWLNAAIAPLMACYKLNAATNALIKTNKEISQFNLENFRRAPEVIADPLLQQAGSQDEDSAQIMEKTVQARIQEQTQEVFRKRKEALLERRGEFEGDFDQMLQEFRDSGEICSNLSKSKEYFECKGLTIHPSIASAGELLEKFGDVDFKESMLARYIDVNSKQQVADSVRNGLKTLTMKKLQIGRRGRLQELGKSKVMLVATCLSCIITVTLTGLAATGIVAVPMIALFIPAFGMMGLSAVLLSVGLFKFHKNSPNFFSELLNGSCIKLIAYNIPKSIQEMRQGKLAIKKFKNKMATELLTLKEQSLSDDDPKKIKAQEKLKKLSEESSELDDKLQKVEEKLTHWETKIKPLASKIAQAKWKDFLQDQPRRLKEGSDDLEIMETIKALKRGLFEGATYFEEDVLKIAKEQFGIDIKNLQEPQVIAALMAFAP